MHQTAISDLGIHQIPNGGDLTHCVAPIVLNFIATTHVGSTACANRIRPIRTVPKFATLVSQVEPAIPGSGNDAADASLRTASATAETVGDVLSRFYVAYGNKSIGLRGGPIRVCPDRLWDTLRNA